MLSYVEVLASVVVADHSFSAGFVAALAHFALGHVPFTASSAVSLAAQRALDPFSLHSVLQLFLTQLLAFFFAQLDFTEQDDFASAATASVFSLAASVAEAALALFVNVVDAITAPASITVFKVFIRN